MKICCDFTQSLLAWERIPERDSLPNVWVSFCMKNLVPGVKYM